MTIKEIIEGDNQVTKKTYPSGKNHRGTKLEWYKLEGHKIYAINLSQAKNILHQAKVDAK